MKISKIKLTNYKSFEDVHIELNYFNAIVGDCAAGKSNFIEVFKLLKNICENNTNGFNMSCGCFIQNLKHKSDPSYLNIIFSNKNSSKGISYKLLEDNAG